MAQADPSLRVHLELGGRDIETVSEYSLESDYLTSTDGFSFTAYNPDPTVLRDLELSPVELSINGHSQMLGRIEKSRVGDDGSAWTFEGRDYISALVECHIDPSFVVKQDMLMVDVVPLAAAPVGIEGCVGDDEAPLRNIRTGRSISGKAPPSGFREVKAPDLKPEPGQGIYEFLNRLAARLGVTIQPAGHRGVIALSRPHYGQDASYKIYRDEEGRGNLMRAAASRDFSSMPSFAMFSGKGARAGKTNTRLVFDFDVESYFTGFGGEIQRILDGKMHLARLKPGEVPPQLAQLVLYRLLYQNDKDVRTHEQLENLVNRAMAERIKGSIQYEVTMPGHSDPETGAVYAVDTVAEVNDSICNIHEPMWVASRRFEYSKESGATTTLRLWRLHSYRVSRDG